jgi:prepilin-type N-terminal cleavage/methylation domain-containing protein
MTRAIDSATRSPPGFTLLEMLVVITILAVLSMVALPRLRLNEGARMREITRAIIVDLRLTRDEAIRRARMAIIIPTANGYRLSPSGQSRTLPRGMSVAFEPSSARLISDSGLAVRFFSDGSATAGELLLSQGGSTVRIVVSGGDGGVRLHE